MSERARVQCFWNPLEHAEPCSGDEPSHADQLGALCRDEAAVWLKSHCPNRDKVPDAWWEVQMSRLTVTDVAGRGWTRGACVPTHGWWAVPRRVGIQGTTLLELCRLLAKLSGLRSVYRDGEFPDPLDPELALDFADFRSLFLCQELATDLSSFLADEAIASHAVLMSPVAKAGWELVERLQLPSLFRKSYEPGDVIFYDLDSREKVGEVDLSSQLSKLLFRLQKRYDRFSHSGLYVHAKKRAPGAYTVGERPAVYHSIGSRVKILRLCASFACLPKREIDLSCIFGDSKDAWTGLCASEREEACRWYREGVVKMLHSQSSILNRTADSQEYLLFLAKSSAPVCQSMDVDPCSTWKLTRKEEAGSCGPPPAVMCSGFTASLLLEIWRGMVGEFQKAALEAGREGRYSQRMRLECCAKIRAGLERHCLQFTPKDLHQWPVWKKELSRPPALLKIAAGEVRSAFADLITWDYTSAEPVSPPPVPPRPESIRQDGGHTSDRLQAVSSTGPKSRQSGLGEDGARSPTASPSNRSVTFSQASLAGQSPRWWFFGGAKVAVSDAASSSPCKGPLSSPKAGDGRTFSADALTSPVSGSGTERGSPSLRLSLHRNRVRTMAAPAFCVRSPVSADSIGSAPDLIQGSPTGARPQGSSGTGLPPSARKLKAKASYDRSRTADSDALPKSSPQQLAKSPPKFVPRGGSGFT